MVAGQATLPSETKEGKVKSGCGTRDVGEFYTCTYFSTVYHPTHKGHCLGLPYV